MLWKKIVAVKFEPAASQSRNNHRYNTTVRMPRNTIESSLETPEIQLCYFNGFKIPDNKYFVTVDLKQSKRVLKIQLFKLNRGLSQWGFD